MKWKPASSYEKEVKQDKKFRAMLIFDVGIFL
jgi:hypothetical protein